jgi:hypothetical protein
MRRRYPLANRARAAATMAQKQQLQHETSTTVQSYIDSQQAHSDTNNKASASCCSALDEHDGNDNDWRTLTPSQPHNRCSTTRQPSVLHEQQRCSRSRVGGPRTQAARVLPWIATTCVVLTLLFPHVEAWGGGSSSSKLDTSAFGNMLDREWLYSSTAMSIKLEGCLWSYADDSENSGCMEQSSEDGTTYWYQMANCLRAQAIFSVYSSDSGSTVGCSKSNFKESVCAVVTVSVQSRVRSCLTVLRSLISVYHKIRISRVCLPANNV